VGLDFSKEEKGWSQGFLKIAGVDEAGRGPLAGPVVAAAVVFPAGTRLEGLDDSKKISPKKREVLFGLIQSIADVGIGIVSEKIIDQINILQAARLAMRAAVQNLKVTPDCLLIDGNSRIDLALKQQTIVQGDALVASIAAASIIAKVTRDRLMMDYHKQFPDYGFDQHKGYPSPSHIAAIRQNGFSPIHRKTFRVKSLA
jgi:ribonuclease HII